MMTTPKNPIKLDTLSYNIRKEGLGYIGRIAEVDELTTPFPDDFAVKANSLEGAASALEDLTSKLILNKRILLPRQCLIDHLFKGHNGYEDPEEENPPLSLGVSVFIIYAVAGHLANAFDKKTPTPELAPLPDHYYKKYWDHGGFIEPPIDKAEFLGKLGFFREGKESKAFQSMLLSEFVLGEKEDLERKVFATRHLHYWSVAQVRSYSPEDVLEMEASVLAEAPKEALFLFDCFKEEEEACERFITERSF